MKELFRESIEVANSENPFLTESGYSFSSAPVAYESYGALNHKKTNVILLLHGLSGHTHAASHHEEDEPGWWEPVIGAGKLLDSDRFFILIPNLLGSCFGSLGPLTIDPNTQLPYGAEFPPITVRDMVRLHRRLLDQLQIESPQWVIGGSLGGMQALEWVTLFPEDGANVISIVAPEKTSAQAIGFNHIMRRAIFNDPNWNDGKYDPASPPRYGMATARAIGMLTYQTEESTERKFGRRQRDGQWEIESYLDYQGNKMAESFDANSYLRLIDAMDTYDLERDRDNYHGIIERKKGRILLVGDDSDFLYGISHQKNLAEKWRHWGANANWHDLHTQNGHDSFLVNFKELEQVVRGFMEKAD